VSEHQLFSQGLKELQNWVADTSHMLQTYCTPTADKNVLDSRMIKLEVTTTAENICHHIYFQNENLMPHKLNIK